MEYKNSICYSLKVMKFKLICIFWDFRGLKNIMTLHIKKLDSSEWEKVPVPKRYVSLQNRDKNTTETHSNWVSNKTVVFVFCFGLV